VRWPIALVVVAGCGSLLLNVTSVDLTLSFSSWPSTELAAVRTLRFDISGAQSGSHDLAVQGVVTEERLELRPKASASGSLNVVVTALDDQGNALGAGSGSFPLESGHAVPGKIDMTASAPPPEPDLATTRDSGPPPPDLSSKPDLSGPCQLVPQGGCASEKCTISGSQAVCAPDGTVGLSGGCSPSADHCVHGELCSPVIIPVCRQMCLSDNDCTEPPPPSSPGGRAKCVIGNPTVDGVKLCSLACDPVPGHTSGCIAGFHCQLFAVPEFTDCRPATGTGGDGVACNFMDECLSGYGCYSTGGGPGHCRPICRAGNNADCTVGGETCVALTNHTDFGACCPGVGC
jgi:hypothetical protein